MNPTIVIAQLSDGRQTEYSDTLFNVLTNCDNVDFVFDKETGELYYSREDNYIADEYRYMEEV